jgi:hypothetical protein
MAQPRLDWSLKWLADERLYAVDQPPPSQNTSHFWAVGMDSSTGRRSRIRFRITTGDDFVNQRVSVLCLTGSNHN